LQLCTYYVKIICKERINVKSCNEFSNDPMKMFFEHKKRMKVHQIIKYVKIVFSSWSCDFWWSIFCHEFSTFGHAHFFFLLHCGLHSFKVLHNKWCSFHYVCMMWKEMTEKISGLEKEKCIIFFNVLLKFFFGINNYFDMCFDNFL